MDDRYYDCYPLHMLPERLRDRIIEVEAGFHSRHTHTNLWTGITYHAELLTRCWIWTGKWDSGNGYGKVRHKGDIWMAHRLVYSILSGPIPTAHVLDHRCRTRRCCNPIHLDPVTSQVNTHRGEAVLFKQEAQQ